MPRTPRARWRLGCTTLDYQFLYQGLNTLQNSRNPKKKFGAMPRTPPHARWRLKCTALDYQFLYQCLNTLPEKVGTQIFFRGAAPNPARQMETRVYNTRPSISVLRFQRSPEKSEPKKKFPRSSPCARWRLECTVLDYQFLYWGFTVLQKSRNPKKIRGTWWRLECTVLDDRFSYQGFTILKEKVGTHNFFSGRCTEPCSLDGHSSAQHSIINSRMSYRLHPSSYLPKIALTRHRNLS